MKPELLRVLALTGALVTIIEVPGVISLRAFARNVGSMDMRVARSLRFGTRLPTLAIDSQSRRPLESTVANAEKAYEPRIPLSPPDRCASYLDPITIDVARAVGGTDDDGYRAVRCFLRLPHDGPGGRRAGCCPGEDQSWIRGRAWTRAVVGNDHGRADMCHLVEFRGKILRQSHAAVRGRIAGKLSGVHGDPAPSQPLACAASRRLCRCSTHASRSFPGP